MTDAVAQALWAELLVATLADAGVRRCVLSPGSRSTPLVAALAGQAAIATITTIDERTAAFQALGLARVDGAPVALVCTSGTAAAHYLPAVIEASCDHLPLVVVTADRPPELWQAGASQTIDQTKLFGDFVRTFVDLGAPVGTALALRALRRRVAQAVRLATGPRPGPVHLQVPLRKPLEPRPARTDDELALVEVVRGLRASALAAQPAARAVADDAAVDALVAALAASARPLLVAGPGRLAAARAAVAALGQRAGVVIAAETCSQLRAGRRGPGPTWVDHLDLIAAADVAPRPDLVVQLGHEPVGAAWPELMRTWADVPRWIVAGVDGRDPDASATGVVVGDVADVLARVAAAVPARADATTQAWALAWQQAEAAAVTAVSAALAAYPDGEPALLAALWADLPATEETALVVGNSLPIRVLDWVAAGGGAAGPILSQRGASGIDGQIAAAAGVGATRPVLAIVGDVSFAHDLGGLLAARTAPHPVVVVVIDNDGGRIFDGLPVAATLPAPTMRAHFHTPPGLAPAAIAQALGAGAAVVTSPSALGPALRVAFGRPGLTVLHAPVHADGARRFRVDVIARLRAGASVRLESPASTAASVSQEPRR
ncbi:MAG: 2-succinyl-5-enolpyruvyl-6-hydroxy-3-cyclohexene-1-carboxylic-acid synthase [Kofleriaceae bacterium]|nr:2-succinyl-5-enolpyruvyl-6-hydroxy-3-cyclohexene-1-carboxylic-acid synthase [Kofleriaceae bacterium]MBP9207873.1 2-succinyl-5-enolpyruvyl-6-hydroxy-3-cyclohexene-1-carboxylic-acid synthase [Kofleriaceae bacterium]